MIEQELKGSITLDIYNELSNRIIWDKKYVQINFYYTNNHINNQNIHTTLQEKLFWNNKINVDDSRDVLDGELSDETLILNRN